MCPLASTLRFLLVFALPAVPLQAQTLIVLNKAEATASLIDAGNGQVVATLPVGDGPHEAAVSPDGRWLLACNYGAQAPGNSLTLIDIEKARVKKTIDLGEYQRPHGIAWSKDGRHAWVTIERSDAIIRVDVKQGKVVEAIRTDQKASHMLALSPDERRAYVANIASGTITVLDLEHGRRLWNIATGKGAEGIDVSPDGNSVWVTNRAVDTVSVVDTKTAKVVAELPAASFPIRAKATPDGRHVLVTAAASGELIVFDAKTLKEERRVDLSAHVEAPKDGTGGQFAASSVPIGILIEPSGKRAFIAHQRGGVISVIDLRTWTILDQYEAGESPDGMAWSALKVKRRSAS
jgi:YVTN family beta-propeller protein